MIKDIKGRIGYKAAHSSQCRNVQIVPGEILSVKGKPKLCQNGFHFCLKGDDVFKHYAYNNKINFYEVKVMSSMTDYSKNKCSTNRLKVIREITSPDEIFSIFDTYKKYNDNGVLTFHKYKRNAYINVDEYDENRGTAKRKAVYNRRNVILSETFYSSDGFNVYVNEKRKYSSGRLVESVKYNSVGQILHIKKAKEEFFYTYYKDQRLKSESNGRIKRTYSYHNEDAYCALKEVRENGVLIFQSELTKKGLMKSKFLVNKDGVTEKYSYTPSGFLKRIDYSNGKFEKFKFSESCYLSEYSNSDGACFIFDKTINFDSSKRLVSDNVEYYLHRIGFSFYNQKFSISMSSNCNNIVNQCDVMHQLYPYN